MRCPLCGNQETKVLDSRQVEEGLAIRRRRECDQCSRRFTTYEKYDEIPLIVVKTEGRREPFDRTKILNGMLKACEKRPISVEVLEVATTEIEKKLRNTMEREVTSKEIGELIMDKLAEIDEVAYIRFASVYRQFKDINRFAQELNELLQKKN
ncbi:MAG TPA: transcriptional regulator NrdR [Candidatus Deferrimicrobium sp.]|jgi:transcriptional repressor NrdR|nr:transcriptional regulator NrdR [Candidatus Deferrimicrobium sp.]